MAHIQIGDISPRIQYTANGSVTTFAFPFPIFENSDLLVYLDGALQSSGYTVSGAGETAGGSAVFSVAPGNGVIVTLGRSVPIERTTNFQDGGAFRAAVINEELDRLVCMAQQLQEELGRTVRRPLTSTSTAPLDLPEPVPGRALKFGTDGALVLSNGDPDAAQSDAAAQVALATLQAAAAAAARTSAEAARDQVLALYDAFDDRYLGVHASAPATDNDGNPLFPGALYFQQTEAGVDGVMKVYTGSAWVAAYVSGDSILTAANLLALLATLDAAQQAAALANIGGLPVSTPHLLQRQRVVVSAPVTVNSAIPFDNTKPQNTEGTLVASLAFTPISATSRLKIRGSISGSATAVAALVLDVCRSDVLDSLGATFAGADVAGTTQRQLVIDIDDVASPGALKTFQLRAGISSGTFYVNANGSGVQLYGGASTSFFEIEEWSA